MLLYRHLLSMPKTQKNSAIIAIAALGKNTRYICRGTELLWHNPDDLKRVKALTLGHPLIMGRKTYESIGRPLPGRTNIILTRNTDFTAPGCVIVSDKQAALNAAANAPGGDKIFIFGGAEIYTLFLNDTDTLMLTLYESDKPGTARFPEFASEFTQATQHGEGTFENEPFAWVDYVRK